MQRLHGRHWRIRYSIFVALVLVIVTACAPAGPAPTEKAPATVPAILLPTTTVPLPTAAAALPIITGTTTVRASASPTSIPSPTFTQAPTFAPITPTATLVPLAIDARQAVFQETWELVRDQYVYADYRGLDWQAIHAEFAPRVAAADNTAQFYELMRELIQRLGDDHSNFESPQQVVEEDALFEGHLNYAGIGALIREVPEGGLITQLARGGPAEEAGLQPRDIVVAIGSRPFTDTEHFGPDGPISAVRGMPGTTVRLTVRSADGIERDVVLVRRLIASDAFAQVQTQRLPGTAVGLLRIDTFFVEDIDQQVRAALEELTQSGPLKGLLIDVRTNAGGRVDLMAHTVALFADGGRIGATADRSGTTKMSIPEGETLPQLEGVPLVVLTSEDTASAAEMFAAGMRAAAKAQLIGTTTAGNTENLRKHRLSDGSELWLAELMYIQPDGTPNEGHGVEPDRTVAAEWWRYSPGDDPQIRAALGMIQGDK